MVCFTPLPFLTFFASYRVRLFFLRSWLIPACCNTKNSKSFAILSTDFTILVTLRCPEGGKPFLMKQVPCICKIICHFLTIC